MYAKLGRRFWPGAHDRILRRLNRKERRERRERRKSRKEDEGLLVRRAASCDQRGRFQIAKNLCGMLVGKGFGGFQLNNEPARHQQASVIVADEGTVSSYT